MAAGALIVSEAGGVVRFVFISSLYLSSFPHYICIHFPIIFVFIFALYLSSFPHYICLALLAVVSIFLLSRVLVSPFTGFGSLWRWLWPDELWYSCLQVTTGQATVIWSYCKILLESKLSNILIYFQHSSSGRPGSGLHSTLCYLKVTKALLVICWYVCLWVIY